MRMTKNNLRLKNIREYRNYTQTYMADRLEISQNAYSNMENGITPITTDRLKKIAEILDVNVNMILNEQYQIFNIDKNQSADIAQHSQQTITVLQDEVHYLREQNERLIKMLGVKFRE